MRFSRTWSPGRCTAQAFRTLILAAITIARTAGSRDSLGAWGRVLVDEGGTLIADAVNRVGDGRKMKVNTCPLVALFEHLHCTIERAAFLEQGRKGYRAVPPTILTEALTISPAYRTDISGHRGDTIRGKRLPSCPLTNRLTTRAGDDKELSLGSVLCEMVRTPMDSCIEK